MASSIAKEKMKKKKQIKYKKSAVLVLSDRRHCDESKLKMVALKLE